MQETVNQYWYMVHIEVGENNPDAPQISAILHFQATGENEAKKQAIQAFCIRYHLGELPLP